VSEEKNKSGGNLAANLSKDLVIRSVVPAGLKYGEYRQQLRVDFFFSCAYCMIAETEAMAIRFTIDHYEPEKLRPDLLNEYGNLMYCCDTCNVFKGPRWPKKEHLEKGYGYFRPDRDVYGDHFELKGLLVRYKTPVAFYTINALDLNRKALQRLRELRQRMLKCDEYMLKGIKGLREFQLDQLPPQFRGRALTSINQTVRGVRKLGSSIDRLLMANARSPLIDEDEETQLRAKERKERLKQIEGLRPGMLKGWKA
jgi:hypothetical protein